MSLLPTTRLTTLLDLPEELLLHIISFLRATDLKITEKVCTLLQRLSQDNFQWKSLHFKKFHISTEWIGPSPIVWKTYSENVETASQNWQFSTVDHLRYTKFWKMGLFNEHLGMCKPHDLPSAFLVYSVMGEHKKALDLMGKNEPKKQIENLYHGIAQIIILLDQKKFEEALNKLQELRPLFKKRQNVWSWWILRLISTSTFFKRNFTVFKYPDLISLPHPPDPTTLSHFQGVLLGCYAAWLARKDFDKVEITLECLEQTRRTYTKKGSTALSDDLFYQITRVIQLNPSSTLWQKYAKIALRVHSDRKDYLQRGSYAYGESIKLTPVSSIRTRMRLAYRLTETMVQMDPHPEQPDEFQMACLPVLVFKEATEKRLTFPPLYIADVIDITCTYKIEIAYRFILENIQIRDFNVLKGEDLIKVYFNLIHLCNLTKNFEKAIDIWVNLSLITHQKWSQGIPFDPYTDETMYDKIYEILDQSTIACRKLVSTYERLTHPEIVPALVCACFRLNDENKAIQILVNRPGFFNLREIKSLFPFMLKNLTAAIACSLHISTIEDLENYYEDLLDYFPAHHFFIYHNLAVRLFFLDEIEKSLDIILVGFERNLEEPETHVIEIMIYHRLGKKELAQEALKKAHALNEEFILEKTDYPELRLLITPKDA